MIAQNHRKDQPAMSGLNKSARANGPSEIRPHSPCSLVPKLPAFFLLLLLIPLGVFAGNRPRLCIMTDIGGDPDDQQSLVRLMVYANAFEFEGLLATSSGSLGDGRERTPRPDLILQTIDAYANVLPHLRTHADGWPEPDALRAVVHPGQAARGLEAIGPAHDTAASAWLIARVRAGAVTEPLNVSIWGGQTDLAQALWRVRHDGGEGALADFVSRLRVYDIGDQDRIAAWMRAEFPGLHYVLASVPPGQDRRESTYRGMYLTGDESLTSLDWIERHVRSASPLGALYPIRTWTAPNPHRCMKEGDTPAWFFFLPAGGNDPADPTHSGWGGRFQREPDGWYRDLPATPEFDPRTTVSDHRPAFQADFARRMAWTRAETSTP